MDSEKRKSMIVESARKEAASIGADVYMEDGLLEEVTNICEWPVPVICNFDEKYLDIPEKVTDYSYGCSSKIFSFVQGRKIT